MTAASILGALVERAAYRVHRAWLAARASANAAGLLGKAGIEKV